MKFIKNILHSWLLCSYEQRYHCSITATLPLMTTQPPDRPTDRVALPADVQQEHLEQFVRRANNGVYDAPESKELTAAVAVIETLLDRETQSTTESQAVPSAAKWAAAAGYGDSGIDDG